MSESVCRNCFHSYVCEQFNEHRDSHNKRCHFFNDHFVNAADVVERKRGEWFEVELGWDDVHYDCSVCGESFCLIDGTPTDNMYNFCPNCGADMRRGAEHGVSD